MPSREPENVRLARVEEQVTWIRETLEPFAQISRQVIEAHSDIALVRDQQERLDKRLADMALTFSEELKKATAACEEVREDYRSDRRERSEARGRIVLAVIAASATVSAALIAAIAAILSHA